MAELGFVIPGDPDQKTGGYLYNRRVMEVWRAEGHSVEMISIPYTGPDISSEDHQVLLEKLRSFQGQKLLIDGLAGAWMEEEIKSIGRNIDVYYLEHLPLKRQFYSEKVAIEACKKVIVTSDYAENLLRERGITIPIISIEPGHSTQTSETKTEYSSTVSELVFVGSISPRKDPKILINALKQLTEIPWNLKICGAWQQDSNYVHEVKDLVKEAELADRITFLQDLEQVDLYAIMKDADLMIAPSREETYGMAVAEGLSLGLPILANDIRAFKTVYGERLLYFSGGSELETLLRKLMMESEFYRNLVNQTLQNPPLLFSWEHQADKLWATLTEDTNG